jgi:hypothetical protein
VDDQQANIALVRKSPHGQEGLVANTQDDQP